MKTPGTEYFDAPLADKGNADKSFRNKLSAASGLDEAIGFEGSLIDSQERSFIILRNNIKKLARYPGMNLNFIRDAVKLSKLYREKAAINKKGLSHVIVKEERIPPESTAEEMARILEDEGADLEDFENTEMSVTTFEPKTPEDSDILDSMHVTRHEIEDQMQELEIKMRTEYPTECALLDDMTLLARTEDQKNNPN